MASHILPWHYAGYLNCLLSKPKYAGVLSSRVEALDLDSVFSDATSATPSPAQNSPLIQEVAWIASRAGRHEYPFDPAALARFKLHIVEMPREMVPHEIILTADALYLPWPLFKNPIPIETNLGNAAASRPPRRLSLTDLPEQYLSLGAFYDAVDYLIECDDRLWSQAPGQNLAWARPHLEKIAGHQNAHTYFGTFALVFDPERWIGDSIIEIGEQSDIRVVQGLLREPTRSIDEPRFEKQGEEFFEIQGSKALASPCWPCAVFHGSRRTCSGYTTNCP